jgi:hypothetical protein
LHSQQLLWLLVHIEGFESRKYQRKRGYLLASEAINIAVINADDSYADYWKIK